MPVSAVLAFTAETIPAGVSVVTLMAVAVPLTLKVKSKEEPEFNEVVELAIDPVAQRVALAS